MLCVPADKLLVAHVACPLPFSACAPQPVMVAPPSLKFAVPVGVPPAELTVAVKVTDCPYTEGFVPEVTVVVVEALLTTRVPDPLAGCQLASPAKTATTALE